MGRFHGRTRSFSTVNPTGKSWRAQLGYRAFVHHILTRFNALIVGFGLTDPDFDDMLQTFAENFGGGVRDPRLHLETRPARR